MHPSLDYTWLAQIQLAEAGEHCRLHHFNWTQNAPTPQTSAKQGNQGQLAGHGRYNLKNYKIIGSARFKLFKYIYSVIR